MSNRKIIAIEGIDGSGKTVQLLKLKKHLTDMRKSVFVRDYPVYNSFFGKTVGEYLSNANGVDATSVDPQSMALWYAMDRYYDMKNNPIPNDVEFELMNRYVLSNAVYQGIRAGKADFVDWVFHLEHDVLELPRPDVYLFFNVDYSIATMNVEKKDKRSYTDDKKDVYEESTFIQCSAKEMYAECARRFDNIIVIDCVENGEMLSEDKVHEKVLNALCERKII